MNKYSHFSKHQRRHREVRAIIHGRGTESERAACSRKKTFDSKERALNRAQELDMGDMKAYHCRVCNGWHLAKKRKKRIKE